MASAKAPKLQECVLGACEIMRPAAGEAAKMAIALNRTAPVLPHVICRINPAAMG